jgi:hypothetical protein
LCVEDRARVELAAVTLRSIRNRIHQPHGGPGSEHIIGTSLQIECDFYYVGMNHLSLHLQMGHLQPITLLSSSF